MTSPSICRQNFEKNWREIQILLVICFNSCRFSNMGGLCGGASRGRMYRPGLTNGLFSIINGIFRLNGFFYATSPSCRKCAKLRCFGMRRLNISPPPRSCWRWIRAGACCDNWGWGWGSSSHRRLRLNPERDHHFAIYSTG